MHLFEHTHWHTHECYTITVDHKYIVPPAFSFGSYCSCNHFFPELSEQTVYCAIGTMTLPSHWSGLSAQPWEPLCSLSSACAIWIRVGCHQTLNKMHSPVAILCIKPFSVKLIHSLSFQCECDFVHKLSAVITVMQWLLFTLDLICQKMQCSIRCNCAFMHFLSRFSILSCYRDAELFCLCTLSFNLVVW